MPEVQSFTFGDASSLAEALERCDLAYVARAIFACSAERRRAIFRAANLTPEERRLKRQIAASKSTSTWLNNRPPEERRARAAAAGRAYWSSLSPEEKSRVLSERRKKAWENKTPEEKAVIIAKRKATYCANATPEERSRRNSEAGKKRWSKVSPEERKRNMVAATAAQRAGVRKPYDDSYRKLRNLTVREIRHVIEAVKEGDLSILEIAQEYNLHERSVYRLMDIHGVKRHAA